MDNPPLYLAKSYHDQHLSQPLDPDEEVGNEELLYRRVIDKKYPYKEYFTGLQSAIFNEDSGFSVNRAKYASDPRDVLWIGTPHDETSKCVYSFQERNMVIYCLGQDLQEVNDAFEITFFCQFAPEDCNIAHANIFSDPPLKSGFSKSQRRDIILKLASLFEAA